MSACLRHFIRWQILVLTCCLLAGCERRVSFSGDADQLEKEFGLTSSSQPASDPSTYKTAETPVLVKTLAVALRSNDLDTAAVVLHTLNYRGHGLSFDQDSAIRRAFGDVSTELSERAAKGDQHAKDLANKMNP